MKHINAQDNSGAGFLFRHTLLTGFLLLLPLVIFGWLLVQQQSLRRQVAALELMAYFRDQVREIEHRGIDQTLFQKREHPAGIGHRIPGQQTPLPELLLIHQDGTIRPVSAFGDVRFVAEKLAGIFSLEGEAVAARLADLPPWRLIPIENHFVIRAPLQNPAWQVVLAQSSKALNNTGTFTAAHGIFAFLLLGFGCVVGFCVFNHRRVILPSMLLLRCFHAFEQGKPCPLDDLPKGAWHPWFQRVELLFSQNRSHILQERKDLTSLDRQLKERTMELERLSLAYRQEMTERKQAETALNRLNLELRELWPVDGLTGIASYRKFQEQLQLFWEQLLRQKRPLSILACSVDCHRQYSDAYGRQAADHRLREIAQAIQSALQHHNDLVARHGRSQFLVLLPGTDAPGSRKVAAAVQQAIAGLDIVRCGQPPESCIRVSIGLATAVPTRDESAAELLDAARSRCQTESHWDQFSADHNR